MKVSRILIIGGGIGGLSAALALQHFGFRVAVFEQAAELKEIGAGVVLTPNGMHALYHLGVGTRVADEAGDTVPYFIRSHQSGAVLMEGPEAAVYVEKYGATYHQGHRADLHQALADAVRANDPDCVFLGHMFESLEQDEHGVVAHFANGATHAGDALIGCDGGGSKVRTAVFGDREVNYMGQVAFRALVPIEAVPEGLRNMSYGLFIGPQRLLLHYPLRRGTIMNVIGIAREPRWQDEGWAIPATREEFAELYSDFHPDALALIHSISPDTLFKWGLRDREPLQQWVRGRVAMLGDAAHPMSPFLGQGACIAIEDAFVLGRSFAAADTIEDAFALYEGTRKERGNGVQLASRDQADQLQGVTRKGSNPGQNAEERGLFSYDPVRVPLQRAS